jgi:hypothetical protein
MVLSVDLTQNKKHSGEMENRGKWRVKLEGFVVPFFSLSPTSPFL